MTNEEKSIARRNAILDAAQMLVYTKGYELMTIQDLLEQLQISKGAFYHYFPSKQSLLEAIIERTLAQVEQVIQPILQDPHTSAIQKFETFFSTVGNWKTTRVSFMLGLLRAMYSDENALFRQKMVAQSIDEFAGYIDGIIRQGLEEGVFSSPYPDQLGELMLVILQAMGDSLSRQILEADTTPITLEALENTVEVHTHAVERVLGAAPGSIRIMDSDTLKPWVTATASQPVTG
jgi:AcrR family transcriptional regulator